MTYAIKSEVVHMDSELGIVQLHGSCLLDSRLLAARLGYEHETVARNIKRHHARLEAKSVLRQIVGKPASPHGGRPEVYYLLDERQCLILAGSLKKGRDADEWHDRLVDAFLEARKQLERLSGGSTHAQPDHARPAINRLWEKRLIAFYRETKIPDGYWSIFGFVAGHCFMDSWRSVHLVENALPDGSIGRLWCRYLRTHGFDMNQILTYPHTFPDKRGVQPANIYPNEWLGDFWDWFQTCYLCEHYPRYVAAHSETTPSIPGPDDLLGLPSPKPQTIQQLDFLTDQL
jgi:Phage regulatory protein Rha (Phage_pRha)